MIPHNRPLIKPADEEAVLEVLRDGHIAQGPRVEALEREFCTMLGGGYACAVSSGTAALAMALHGLGVGKGDFVAVPTYACSALLNAVHFVGAKALPIDSREDDFTIDVWQASGFRNVIAVNTFGAQANIAELINMGGRVIEDCAHSLGGKLGIMPDARTYSFGATKIITGGAGGLVWSREDYLVEAAKDYREFDCVEEYYPRFNLQMTDMQAAMVSSQLSRIDAIRIRRAQISYEYRHACEELLFGQEWKAQSGVDGAFAMPYRFVLVASTNERRDELYDHLLLCGVSTIVPLEQYELLHNYLGMPKDKYPVAEHLAATTISIPLYPALDKLEIDTICDALRRFR